MHTFSSLATLKASEGKNLGYSDWIIVSQSMIDAFAESTKDKQWIHTNPERAAKESPFGSTIAHGFLSLSLLSTLIESMVRLESVNMGVNYGLNKVRFPDFVPVNSRLRLQLGVKKVLLDESGKGRVIWDCVLEREGGQKPVCVAEFITVFYE